MSTSTSAISHLSLLADSLATIRPAVANQTTLTNAATVNAASHITNDTTGDSQGTLTKDTVTLLKDLAKGDTPAANTALGTLQTDLQTQAASATSTKINSDLTSLLKDLHSNDGTAIKTDLTNLNSDLQTQNASTANIKTVSSQNVSPLAALLHSVTQSLSSGNVQGALEDVAGYLVQNGQVTGSLLNVSA